MNRPRYRKIGASYFSDEKILTLSPIEKLVALYLLIGQMNRIGLYAFSIGRAVEDLGLPRRTFMRAFERVLVQLGWQYDADARVIFIKTWWKYNQPENPNVLSGALRDLDGIPKTKLLKDFKESLLNLPTNLLQNLPPNVQATTMEPMPTQYLEQEHKQEPVTGAGFPPKPSQEGGQGESVPALLLAVINRWNQIPAVTEFQGDPGPALVRRFKKHAKAHPEDEFWTQLLKTVTESSYLRGHNENSWCVSLPWLLVPHHFEAVLSGAYP